MLAKETGSWLDFGRNRLQQAEQNKNSPFFQGAVKRGTSLPAGSTEPCPSSTLPQAAVFVGRGGAPNDPSDSLVGGLDFSQS